MEETSINWKHESDTLQPTTEDEMIPQPILDIEKLEETGYQVSGRFFAGTRCQVCGASQLDAILTCQSCSSTQIEPATFGAEGVLYSFTTIYASTKSADPYTLAYVDLDDGPRVLGEVLHPDNGLSCGVRVVAVPSELALGAWGFQIEEKASGE